MRVLYLVQVIACSFVEHPIVGIILTVSADGFRPSIGDRNFHLYSRCFCEIHHHKSLVQELQSTAIKVETA